MDSEIYKIVIGRPAYDDVDDAVTCYESQAEGLGFQFLTRFNDVRAFLHKNPLIYHRTYANAVFYELKPPKLRIFSIA